VVSLSRGVLESGFWRSGLLVVLETSFRFLNTNFISLATVNEVRKGASLTTDKFFNEPLEASRLKGGPMDGRACVAFTATDSTYSDPEG